MSDDNKQNQPSCSKPLETPEELRSLGFYYHVFQTSPASIGIFRLEDKCYVDINEGFTKLLGYSRQEIIGQSLDDLLIDVYHTEDEKKAIHDQLRQQKTIYREELKVRHKNGSVRNVIGSLVPIEANGSILVCQKLVDITQIRQLEQEVLEAREVELQRLGQTLHDDLGQRISGIVWLCDILRQDLEEKQLPEAKQAEEVLGMLKEADQATRQLARGMFPESLKEKGLMPVLEKMASRLEKTYNINCSLVYDTEALEVELATAEQLYRIAQEAAGNAAKHSQAQTIEIRLQHRKKEITLSVLDDGAGISEEALNKRQGLGLRTMTYRARSIGANLEIRRRPEGGTEVSVHVR